MNKKIKIYWLANPGSPHVRHWDELVSGLDCYFDFEIMSIWHKNNIGSIEFEVVKYKKILPRFIGKLPEIVQYLILGVYIRFSKDIETGSIFHAHNTSGYGLVALVSGYCFGITTYGSEIFSAQKKGWFYRFIIRQVLKKSKGITSASPAMTQNLIEYFDVEEEKIVEFSLGVSKEFFYDKGEGDLLKGQFGISSSPIWMLNRRVHPIYHTMELVTAFIKVRNEINTGYLFILEGDSDADYFSKIEAVCLHHDYIKLIRGFIPRPVLRHYLSAADFAISIPDTDQLSSSILEGAMCGAIPLLRDMTSYAEVKKFSLNFRIESSDNEFSYEDIFISSYQLLQSEAYGKLSRTMLNEINKFDMQSVLPHIRVFYNNVIEEVE